MSAGAGTDAGPGQPVGVGRDENRPGARRLLETGSDVCRQTDGAVVTAKIAADGADDHLAGSDADAELDLAMPLRGKRPRIAGDRISHLQGRVAGLTRMLRGGSRRPE